MYKILLSVLLICGVVFPINYNDPKYRDILHLGETPYDSCLHRICFYSDSYHSYNLYSNFLKIFKRDKLVANQVFKDILVSIDPTSVHNDLSFEYRLLLGTLNILAGVDAADFNIPKELFREKMLRIASVDPSRTILKSYFYALINLYKENSLDICVEFYERYKEEILWYHMWESLLVVNENRITSGVISRTNEKPISSELELFLLRLTISQSHPVSFLDYDTLIAPSNSYYRRSTERAAVIAEMKQKLQNENTRSGKITRDCDGISVLSRFEQIDLSEPNKTTLGIQKY